MPSARLVCKYQGQRFRSRIPRRLRLGLYFSSLSSYEREQAYRGSRVGRPLQTRAIRTQGFRDTSRAYKPLTLARSFGRQITRYAPLEGGPQGFFDGFLSHDTLIHIESYVSHLRNGNTQD